eukprot:CAMPEP_0176320564 /NCGR_PEP_ID=MMETSP0121_2-20121125/70891_1 /TAXON_ID=160619 /ORGANISM="Kryptoperidinium foliaceum, Strain CCMP 1326" /LENGTH=111 /DNA_ID=CAMNT_0017662965 /DNA_START=273 /DNA_END=606 /DNA_ORIENTATION=+
MTAGFDDHNALSLLPQLQAVLQRAHVPRPPVRPLLLGLPLLELLLPLSPVVGIRRLDDGLRVRPASREATLSLVHAPLQKFELRLLVLVLLPQASLMLANLPQVVLQAAVG